MLPLIGFCCILLLEVIISRHWNPLLSLSLLHPFPQSHFASDPSLLAEDFLGCAFSHFAQEYTSTYFSVLLFASFLYLRTERYPSKQATSWMDPIPFLVKSFTLACLARGSPVVSCPRKIVSFVLIEPLSGMHSLYCSIIWKTSNSSMKHGFKHIGRMDAPGFYRVVESLIGLFALHYVPVYHYQKSSTFLVRLWM